MAIEDPALRSSAPQILGRNTWGALTSETAVLLAILILGAGLRFWQVGQPLVDMFSWREASTAMMADNFRERSWNIFYPEVSWTGPGPSYQGREFQVVSYITALLQSAFGWSDWLGRAVAASFGTLSIYAMHGLTRRVWGVTHAHAAALILALTPGAIAIDSSFLPDPAMLAFTCTGFWLLMIHLEEERLGYLFAAAVVTAVGILAKLPGLAVLIPMGFAALAVPFAAGRLTPGTLALLSSAALAVFIAVSGYYGWAIYLGTNYPPYHVAGNGYLWDDGWAALVANDFHIPQAWRTASGWLFTLPVLILTGLGLLAGPPSPHARHASPARWIFHVWLAGFGLLFLLASREITANPWNFLLLTPAIAALAGRGLLAIVAVSRSSQSLAAAVRGTAVIMFVFFIGTLPGLSFVKTPYAEESKILGERLSELSLPGDLVVTVARQAGDPVAIYYSRRRGWVFPPGGGARDWSTFLDDQEGAIAELRDLQRRGATWFGIARGARDSKQRLFVTHHQPLMEFLDRTAERVVDADGLVIFRLGRSLQAPPQRLPVERDEGRPH